ncbi:hypothetical protein [Janibacter sp. LM]|uniref:hypothetical protein n=1 Tax=Janibacter sp. LM TaxID=3144845 RepID=UPI0031F6DC1E
MAIIHGALCAPAGARVVPGLAMVLLVAVRLWYVVTLRRHHARLTAVLAGATRSS